MANINASFSPLSRTDQFHALLNQLEILSQGEIEEDALAQFDRETETLLAKTFGKANPHMETYQYAVMGEAEAVVNLPESAQEPLSQDLFMKAVQQRRQLLQGILPQLEELEAVEEEALAGEDHEDPPGMPT
ncbi:hypothetical protein [Candidatus Nitronereus thalassa]|uniref:Uncharacterized protein n=1 Tax=Candidatus Nitronereus thalassa TaxID=3020898 RepID=A0ABU3KBB6_9BACT|nr:hypothetical protein [Candidatus Nitronereus thalassa]MDT7043710.1 hypothetical protein [Candidatus Nitronereus thalassa]